MEFGVTVKKRVNDYFKSNNISRLGDYRIWIKVFVLPLTFIGPFILLVTNSFMDNMFLFYGLWLIMGIGIAGSGLGVMHDAFHGALSKNKKVNHFIGSLIMSMAGGAVINWKIQHNVLHHTYPNIDKYDDDIDVTGLLKLSPNQPMKPVFKYQAYYAWFLYGFMTLSWATFKDFKQLLKYEKQGLIKKQGTTYKTELRKLVALKIIYLFTFIVLPLLAIDVAWWHSILGWFSMHFVAGLTLGCVFLPAHVVPTSDFPKPNNSNVIANDYFVHQLRTTSNFAPSKRIFSWYVGGLNYQIEHHLFPTMSHVHHKKVSKIVKATAKEYGLPYNSQPTFIGAIINHAKMLKKMSAIS
ncbi:MAG: acyl-CoA desaturase [Bacteroidia bacterium]